MPKRTKLEYSYDGQADLVIDPEIVRRIRLEFEPKFVPVLKIEVWRFDTGADVVYRNFGFGIEHDPSLPILNKPVYSAPKPSTGYLATIGRACAMVEWWPWARKKDGTPGDTIAFGWWVYAYMKECDENTRRLAARSRVSDSYIPGDADERRARAIKARDQATIEEMERQNKDLAASDAEFHEGMVEESANLRSTMLDLTEDEKREVRWLLAHPETANRMRKSVAFDPRRIVIVQS